MLACSQCGRAWSELHIGAAAWISATCPSCDGELLGVPGKRFRRDKRSGRTPLGSLPVAPGTRSARLAPDAAALRGPQPFAEP